MCLQKELEENWTYFLVNANSNWLKESKCDVLQIFEEQVPCELERFENFDVGSDRVGTLFYKTMGNAPGYSQIWKVVKFILILSHMDRQVLNAVLQ